MDSVLIEELKKGALAMEIELSEAALGQYQTYTQELLEWNKVMNLTAITDPLEIAQKHYVDSLMLLRYIEVPKGASIADVGCGAGFPGIPIKIARPDVALTCIDSLGKRVNFLKSTVQKLDFSNCDCIHARAEDAGRDPLLRERYDFAAARAVAKLRVLAEYCLPFVKVGGAFIAMKGGDAREEIAEAESAVQTLGGTIENAFEYQLPGTDMARTIVVMRKSAPCASKYPRPSAKIAKTPL